MHQSPGMALLDSLVRYETRLWNELDVQLQAQGHAPLPTLFALRVVHRHAGTCRVLDLHRDIGISVGAASKFVDRLERDGFVSRSENPTDRRSSYITLTRAGSASQTGGSAALEALLAEHLSGESGLSETTATLERLLDKLAGPDEA